jgi:hypothetical protein
LFSLIISCSLAQIKVLQQNKNLRIIYHKKTKLFKNIIIHRNKNGIEKIIKVNICQRKNTNILTKFPLWQFPEFAFTIFLLNEFYKNITN